MFSLFRKKSEEAKGLKPNASSSDIDSHIRTLKDDYKKYVSGKKETVESTGASSPPVPQSEPEEKPFVKESPMTNAPSFPKTLRKMNPLPVHTEKEKAQSAPPSKTASEEKKGIATTSSLGSDSYYSKESPFEKLNDISHKQTGEPTATKKKGSKRIALFLILLFIAVAIAGSGLYYYWFFIKQPLALENDTETSPDQNENMPGEPEASENVKALKIDPTWDSAKLQEALRRMATNFLAESSDEEIIEVRPVDSEYRQFPVQNFIPMFPVTLPESISQKFLADEYSLFLKREHSEIRAGIVFKVSDTENMLSVLSREEPKLPTAVLPLYLGAELPSVAPSFSSSHYSNADIRYYNFPSPPNTSLDYSIIETPNGGYLILTTSKYSIRSILDYMSEK